MLNVPLGVYVPGDTFFHRMRAGWKFLGLVTFIIATSIWAQSALPGLACFLVTLTCYGIAHIPMRIARGQLLPPLPILVVIVVFQWWQLGWDAALGLFFTLYAAITAATLLTLTTHMSELMDAFEHLLAPLARFGVPVPAISLAMSLTIRLIPLQAQALADAISARKARGADHSIRAVILPVLVRSIRRAEAIGDALLARGAAD
ncbi:energy-coupling factor transporter transmembrane component T family protein [Corynebacterium epidermidicanis]|uniref:ABC-type cobalt transport system, permease component CbiQ n=1 Tax=Corynebacterium epidermidicanis TaxID=1050174 RepID=A0A0G3GUZ3_9CORY|nr:energy-coupling factor transporter transmembrane protein EcfT [Corynebacterium epidermidicanis]AKK03353.1 ABC-type cobalt transport system, permease component CbiQ [Corynebacterium epidermidicanis]